MTDAARSRLAGRQDFEAIAGWVRPDASVLDLGCGDGSLIRYLTETRKVRGYGVEIVDARVIACVRNGVNVIQSDLERGLSGFDAGSFDYVILSQTLQAVRQTEQILMDMLRVGREVIVTFPNFGYWKGRLQIAVGGHMPVFDSLPYEWYDTPNVHLFTIQDFEKFCTDRDIRVLERKVLHDGDPVTFMPNLLGNLAVYRLQKSGLQKQPTR